MRLIRSRRDALQPRLPLTERGVFAVGLVIATVALSVWLARWLFGS